MAFQKNKKSSFSPSKKLGQNFLINKSILKKICSKSEIKFDDTIIEIGPGFGSLTFELAKNAGKVIAIEKDKKLYDFLKKESSELTNLELILGDVLKIDFIDFFSGKKLKLISNLPYSISTPVLFKIVEERNLFSMIIMMIQKELGERIIAKPNSKSYGSLSINLQTYFDINKLFIVSPGSFRPKPKVYSLVIKLTPTNKFLKEINDEVHYIHLIKSAFSSRRKILINSLIPNIDKEIILEALSISKIDHNLRAENLTIDQYIELSNLTQALQHSTSKLSKSF